MAAITFIEIVIGLFVIALLLIPFQSAVREEVMNFSLASTSEGNATRIMNIIDNVWYVLPLVVALGMVYYGIARSQKRNPGEFG